MLLFLAGFLNFIPKLGAVLSSFGVIIFTSIIIFSFVKMNNLVTINYNLLNERQKKLDYLGNVSTSLVHEVKNNIQIIKAYSKMLPESTPLPRQSENMVNMIQVATKQLEDLTNSYTDYINKKSILFAESDINLIIQEAIELTSEMAKEKEIEVSFVKKYRSLKAFVSSTYLKQVFINLIKNSCEAIPKENSIKKIVVTTDIVDDKIIINVSDSGQGIENNKWESIFDPFDSSKKSGMGIGLPFVKKIIFEHNGEIYVLESNKKGTTFRVVLPQYQF